MNSSDILPALNELSKSVPTSGTDYMGDDGLLRCALCHTPRQKRISWGTNSTIVNCLCACMVEKNDRERDMAKRRERMAMIEQYRQTGFPDSQMREYTFDNDDGADPVLREAMLRYVDNFAELRRNGKGLLLYGSVGTGKSFYAACIVNALIDRGYPCLMTSFSRITNKMKGRWEDTQDYIDSLTRLSLVAIDDLGVERDTEYMNEQVTTIIDSFYRAKVPLIITSNFTPRDMSTAEAEIRKSRVYDRLLERCHPIVVSGESRRKQIGRSEFAEMNKLLGLDKRR